MADDVAWDDDDFEPELQETKQAKTDKWEGEDEEDVKDNWDDEDGEKADENENEAAKAVQKKKKKPLKERIAEKEEERKREAEQKKRREEEMKASLRPLNPEERAAEKQRIQREQEEADLMLAMEAFGSNVPSDMTGKSLDKMNPTSREDFETFGTALKTKLLQYEKSPHYVFLLDTLIRDVSTGLEPEDLKKLGSTLNALANEKSKQQKAKGKKKSKKAQIMTVRDGDFENDYGDEVGGGEYDDFI